jgi:hypothetical protein
MDERRWMECGKHIGRAGNGTNWWIGDWLRYGNARYGERYRLAARVTGYDEQTLMNYAYVAAHIPVSRRRADVSWSHHAEIAKLGAAAQETWLDRVVTDRLSVKDLRVELRADSLKTTPSIAPSAQRACDDVSLCPTCRRPWRADRANQRILALRGRMT